jgi:hypothetical protein
MRTVTTQFPIWNIWVQRPFTFAGYEFMPIGGLVGYADLTRQLLSSPDDVCTVTATRTAEEGAPLDAAVLWDSGRRIDDVMLLFSVGQGRNVHWRQAEWRIVDGEEEVEHGRQANYLLRGAAFGERAVSPFEAEALLFNAEPIITQPGWTQRTGFTTAGLWYLASLNAPVLDQRFLTAWAGLELLTLRAMGTDELDPDLAAIEGTILRWRDARQYDYITDDLVNRWVILRDDFAVRRPVERIFTPRLASIFTRKLQWCLLMALLDLVGMANFARRDSVLRDIRR